MLKFFCFYLYGPIVLNKLNLSTCCTNSTSLFSLCTITATGILIASTAKRFYEAEDLMLCTCVSPPRLLQWQHPRPQCPRVLAWVPSQCPSLAQSPARSPVTTPPPPPRPLWCRPLAPTAAHPPSPPSSLTSTGVQPTHRTQVAQVSHIYLSVMCVGFIRVWQSV